MDILRYKSFGRRILVCWKKGYWGWCWVEKFYCINFL